MSHTQAAAFLPRPLHYDDGPLVWIDCEMTGLDYHKDVILEIAILITNGNLDLVDNQGFRMVVQTEKSVLDNMNDWCIEQHGKSGLTAECLASPHTLEEVASLALKYVQAWVPDRGSAILAGSSVHADRMFLVEQMPSLIDHLHYRIVDVSSIKELCRRWYPVIYQYGRIDENPSAHRALDDIKASISQLKFYRQNIFRTPVVYSQDVAQHQ